MVRSLFVNQLPGLLRVALLDQGKAVHVGLHREEDPPTEGALFWAEVAHVHTGVQAAFCNIGGETSVFLDKGDLSAAWFPNRKTPIEDVLKQGRQLPVQIKRDAFAHKLARVTTDIRLTGFQIILVPNGDSIHFSKSFKAEREPFEAALKELDPTMGWIVRSAARLDRLEPCLDEAKMLLEQWHNLAQGFAGEVRQLSNPDPLMTLLHQKPALDNIFIDDADLGNRLRDQLLRFAPDLAARIKLHLSDTPLFDVYKVESELDKLRAGRVNLKSGGWIEIHPTEALMVIDVNTGKTGKGRGGVSSALRTNLEAAAEAARQIQTRRIGGLVVIDFISAREPDWRKRVEEALRRGFADDPLKTQVLPLNKLGLAVVNRERRERNLMEQVHESCPVCRGSGQIDCLETLAMDIQKQLLRQGVGMAGETFLIRAGQAATDFLSRRHALLFGALEQTLEITVRIEKVITMGPRRFRLDIV